MKTSSKTKSKTGSVIEDRRTEGLNQSVFWKRFGVTQPCGSRYEAGRAIPKPIRLLMWLRKTGRISDRDLADAMRAISK
ncbi:MAG: XRE family transcriptional regulator [Rhodocyclaceae bacterium]|nr:XRE family transcriptional regulator [Rhodocyclaceae bacterium]